MKIRIKSGNDTHVSGMGPSAWDRDTQKMSIHPHLPGHTDHEENDAEKHHKHHIVHRRHPENDTEDLSAADEENTDNKGS